MTPATKTNDDTIEARTYHQTARKTRPSAPERPESEIDGLSADALDTVLSAIRDEFARLGRAGVHVNTIDPRRDMADECDDVRLTFSGPFATAARSATARASADTLARVLLVEDNPIAQLVTSMQLRELGCIACTATSGAGALKALAMRHFDLVLLDCRMPEIDGYETARAIRQLEAGSGQRRVTIVAVTGDGDIECVDKCLSSGMDGHLAKPTSTAALRLVFERFLA